MPTKKLSVSNPMPEEHRIVSNIHGALYLIYDGVGNEHRFTLIDGVNGIYEHAIRKYEMVTFQHELPIAEPIEE